MDKFEEINILDCPFCGGVASLEDEGGWCVYVQCLDCGAHTAAVPYDNEDEHMEAAKKAAANWNFGKAHRPGPGE